jgi:hypothetical protein
MATQTLYAGYLMDVCLRCVFGYKWMNIPNTLPASAGTTSRKLLAFFILCKRNPVLVGIRILRADRFLRRVYPIPYVDLCTIHRSI